MPPGRKTKGKQSEGLDANEARLALQLLDRNEQLPYETLLKVFKLGQTPCPPACGTKGSKGSKDNPECFHGLMPVEGSYRKKGLWQKEPVLGQLGHDPADDKRQAPDVPAGLRNLGNTCYVNAAMQFLQAIPEFRHALYVLEPELAKQDVIRQLRDLFIELHFGPRRYVDPEPFANSLQLNHAIQQDGQEFLKLLLTKLEHTFATSCQQEVSSVVQTLFRGHFSYVTTCRSCQQQSAGSARQVEYYELPLQVQGMTSLRHSMASALASEELVGDNQYHCEGCGRKCDAERQMQLRSLPPYLCLSLQRFVFDMQTFEKKKAMNKLSIPLLLDMGEVLQGAGVAVPDAAPLGPDGAPLLPGSPGCVYELAAVLIHKGTSASHGHYVAHIKMPDSGSWWRFDDETAEEMGQQPTSFPSDHGTTAQAQAAAADKGAAAAADGKAADASAGADASAAGSTGKKRGRGGGAAGSSKRGRGACGSKARKTRDEEDSDYEEDRKAKSSRGRGRGRAAGSGSAGRGCGRKGHKAAGAADYDEEAAFAAAMQQSLQDEMEQQQHMLASFGQAQTAEQQQQQQQQQADTDAMDCDVQQAEPAPQERSRRKCTAAEPAAAGAAAAGAAEGVTAKKKVGRGKAAAAAAPDADVKAEPDAGPAAGAAEVKQLPDEQVEIVSSNAYFLVYRQRISSIGRAAPAAPAAAGTADAAARARAADAGSDAAAAGCAAVEEGQQAQLPEQLLQQLHSLPEAVRQRVKQLHQDFAQACANHQQVKSDALERVKQRQEEVAGISQLLPVQEPVDAGCFISAAWLEAWANSEQGPGPVDNGPLLCSHARLSPDKPPGTLKYLSSTAWEALVGAHQGGPQLCLSDVCRDCLRQQLQGLVSSDYLAELRDQLLGLLADEEEKNAAAGMGDADSPGFYVSKTWLKGFRMRQGTGGGSLQPPTAGITCCHGKLAPESLSGTARRSVVSPEAWALLKEVWLMQVVREVGRKRAKAAKAAAARTAAGVLEDAAAAHDGDVKIVEDDTDADGDVKILDASEVKQEATPAASSDQQQQQQQPQQRDDVKEEVVLQDSDDEQQQQQQQQGEDFTGSRATSPSTATAAPAAGSWQLPIPLDGSAEVTEEQLKQLLPEFYSIHDMDCEVCKTSLAEAVVGHQEVKQQLEVQRAALSKLLAGSVTESLEPAAAYYLVPNEWVATWRAHLQAVSSTRIPGKAVLPPPPGPLPDAVHSLLCTCHPNCPGLAAPLPDIVNKRGRFSQADPHKDALRVITAEDWQQLLLHHSGLPADTLEQPEQQQQQQQQAAAADAALSNQRSSRGRRAGASTAAAAAAVGVQQQQVQQQEQQALLLQRIASMAEIDSGFRGIRAMLRVKAPTDNSTAAEAQLQQQQQVEKQEQRQEQQQEQVQQEAQQLPLLQVEATMNRLHSAVAEQQHEQQQQRQEAQSEQQVDAMDTDVECVSPTKQQLQQQPEVVTLTSSPVVAAAANRLERLRGPAATTAAAAGNGEVEVLAEVAKPAAPALEAVAADVEAATAAAIAAVQAGDAAEATDAISSEDPEGLLAAATQPGDDDWQPAADDDADEQQPGQQQCSSRRTRGKPARRGASAARAGGAADANGDGAASAVTAAAAALVGWLETMPEPCQQHLEAVAAARRAALLVYDAAEVMVELLSEQELPAAFTSTGVERKSRRARKNRQPLKVCSGDTLAQLRLKVFEALSVHPKNQQLYMRGSLLQGEQSTLAQLEVFPGEELRVVNTHEVDNDDYASVFDGVAAGKRRREVETGFKDTALLGCSTAKPAATTAADQEDAGEAGAASAPDAAAQAQQCAKQSAAAAAACEGPAVPSSTL